MKCSLLVNYNNVIIHHLIYITNKFNVYNQLKKTQNQMTVKIQVESSLNREDLNFFIKGNISLEKVHAHTHTHTTYTHTNKNAFSVVLLHSNTDSSC